mmetsp:Transcript_47895/g.126790  ORF Transcript_47895/g.126790 Transcript_47895/m.126790 type:complete len:200 (-) Transcript_47895:267-866(-)
MWSPDPSCVGDVKPASTNSVFGASATSPSGNSISGTAPSKSVKGTLRGEDILVITGAVGRASGRPASCCSKRLAMAIFVQRGDELGGGSRPSPEPNISNVPRASGFCRPSDWLLFEREANTPSQAWLFSATPSINSISGTGSSKSVSGTMRGEDISVIRLVLCCRTGLCSCATLGSVFFVQDGDTLLVDHPTSSVAPRM